MRIGVIGNEASDADSIMSAIVYSWFLGKSGQQCVPYVQCRKEDLEYRLDFQEISTISNFSDIESIRSLHDYTVEDGIDAWILLDHHFPSQLHQARCASLKVVEVVDHHEIVSDETRSFVATVEAVDIRTIGSTCTIVSERIQLEEVPKHLFFMLFLTIVIDTGNLSPALGKTTPSDVEQYQRLQRILGLTEREVGSLYERLVKSKFNPTFWFKATLDQVLRYDMKQQDGVGYSVILRPIEGLADSDIIDFVSRNNFKFFVLSSGAFSDDQSSKLKRELLLYLPLPLREGQVIVNDVLECVDSRVTWPLCESRRIVRFEVLDTAFSRKKFFPKFLSLLPK